MLYQDLNFFVEAGKLDVKSHAALDFGEAPPRVLFAVSTYHRWILWAIRSSQIITKPKTVIHIPMQVLAPLRHWNTVQTFFFSAFWVTDRPGGQGPTYVPPHVTEGLLHSLELQVHDSVQILEKILAQPQRPEQRIVMPTIETFRCLTMNSTSEFGHDWSVGYAVSPAEFELQLRYDLAVWFMFANQYGQAKSHLAHAAKLYGQCRDLPMVYNTIEADSLKVDSLSSTSNPQPFLMAVLLAGIPVGVPNPRHQGGQVADGAHARVHQERLHRIRPDPPGGQRPSPGDLIPHVDRLLEIEISKILVS